MTIVLIFFSVFAAIIPMLLYLLVIWLLDWFDREPLWLLGGTFLWGALGGVGIAIVLQLGLSPLFAQILNASQLEQFSATVLAPLTEEPGKALLLLLIYRSRHFDNASDGFVYGAAAGLGFGMTENAKYFMEGAIGMDPYSWAVMVVLRTLCSAVMHALCSSAVGVSLGFAKQRGWFAFLCLGSLGLFIAMGIHGLWNGLLVIESIPIVEEKRLFVDVAILAVEVFCGISIFLLLLFFERRTIHHYLLREVDQGPLSQEIVEQSLSLSVRIQGSQWIPEGLPKRYVLNVITTLGLRLSQQEKSTGESKRFYDREVWRLREELASLFSLTPPENPAGA